GVDAVVTHELDVFGGEDAAFGHHALALGYERKQIERGLQRGLEAAQVAIVDAHQRGVQLQAISSSARSCTSTSTSMPSSSASDSNSLSCDRPSAATINRMQSAPIARAWMI